ncbi:MAG: hypothetical protein ABIK89_09310 [Planctomycetota bacterium]
MGLPLYWPESVPPDRPREEDLTVIIADRQQDMRQLETPGFRGRGDQSRGGMSHLEKLLAQFRSGGLREAPPESGPADIRYRVEHIVFQLAPSPTADHAEGTG